MPSTGTGAGWDADAGRLGTVTSVTSVTTVEEEDIIINPTLTPPRSPPLGPPSALLSRSSSSSSSSSLRRNNTPSPLVLSLSLEPDLIHDQQHTAKAPNSQQQQQQQQYQQQDSPLSITSLMPSSSAGSWVHDQRTRSPLSAPPLGTGIHSPNLTSVSTPSTRPQQQTHRNITPSSFTSFQQSQQPASVPLTSSASSSTIGSTTTSSISGAPPSTLIMSPTASAPQVARSPSVASPCFVHSHLDCSLSDFVNKKKDTTSTSTTTSPGTAAKRKFKIAGTAGTLAGGGGGGSQLLRDPHKEDDSDTASGGGIHSGEDEDDDDDDDDDDEGVVEEDEGPSLTRQLAETAVSVREMSKQLGRARVVSHIQSVMIITKARDNHLIRLTRELALWLMQTPRNGRDRGLVVYVDHQLRKSKRFDTDGMQRDFPELFRPLPRRYSRTSSSASLSTTTFDSSKRMTPLSQLNDAFKRSASPDLLRKASLGSSSSGGGNGHANGSAEEDGQLRYWTNDMCTEKPHLFDFVVTLGGDGTVLYASWLFQHVVPPVIPFALGSLGFLTNFDFQKYAQTLDGAINNGIRVNLRMRFTCTVYRAIEGDEAKKRRAIRSGKTGGIFMKSMSKDGWEAIESGAEKWDSGGGASGKPKKKDREIKCFSTRPVESFEVLNDLVVDRGPSPYVSQLELFGDEHHMTTVQADGLTVSTPTGSTAYSLSAGGSLVHPEVPALLITPICPHTLSFRPMLLPDSMELRICVPYNSRSTAWASFDGRGRVELRQGDHIKVTASQYPFPTVCAENQSTDWFNAIARTLKWNERQRQKSFVILEEGRKKSKSSPEKEKEEEPISTVPALSATEKARQDFGDEEDEEEESDGEDTEDDIPEEDETYDIDDLSSENTNPATTTSSPTSVPHDPPIIGSIPPLVSHPSSTSSEGHPPPPSSTASSIDLQESTEDRFRDRPPKPPKLSSRHSHNDKSQVWDRSPVSAPPNFNRHRMSSSTARRRERGEEGDRDHIYEQMSGKRGTAASSSSRRGRGSRSRERSQDMPTASDLRSATSAEMSEGRAFAVVGADSDTSLSESEFGY